MRRKFITNLILIVFLNLLIKPFWVLGIDRSVQNVVGPSEYGFYFTILNFAFLFQILLDWGISNFNNRNIAQNNHLLSKHFSSIIILRFLFGVVFMVTIMSIGYLIGYDDRQLYLLSIIGFNQFLLALILYLRSNISGLLLLRVDSFLSVIDRLILIIVCSILLWGGVSSEPFKIEWFVYSQTFAYSITAVIAFLIVFAKTKFQRLNWNTAFFLVIIKQSFPYFILILLMGMYSRIDSVLIERLLPIDGKYQVGVYASAFRLLDVANNMSGYLFAVLLLPLFAKMLKEKENINQVLKLSFTLLFLLSTTVAVTSIFFGHDIMSLLYHQHESETASLFSIRMIESSQIFIIMMFAYVATSTTYIFGTLLTANGSLKPLNIMAFIGMLISLGLNLVLIPEMKAMGAAYAGLTAQVVTAIIQVFLAFKILDIHFEAKYVLKLIAFVLSLFALNWISTFLPYEWIIRMGISLALILMSAFALRLLNIKAFISIIKYEK
jgi:O-antigen/teichoic acid export membrane protein